MFVGVSESPIPTEGRVIDHREPRGLPEALSSSDCVFNLLGKVELSKVTPSEPED